MAGNGRFKRIPLSKDEISEVGPGVVAGQLIVLFEAVVFTVEGQPVHQRVTRHVVFGSDGHRVVRRRLAVPSGAFGSLSVGSSNQFKLPGHSLLPTKTNRCFGALSRKSKAFRRLNPGGLLDAQGISRRKLQVSSGGVSLQLSHATGTRNDHHLGVEQ